MAYFYVRTHADGTGTRTTGGGTTLQTGDWDTTLGAVGNYYASINDAISDSAFTANDVVVCSNIHSIDHGASETISVPDGVIIVSVDDTAIDTPLAGASESSTGSSIYSYILQNSGGAGKKYLRGLTITAENDLRLYGSNQNCYTEAINCTFKCTGTSNFDYMLMVGSSADGQRVTLVNSDIKLPDAGSLPSNTGFIVAGGGSEFRWKGGSILTNTTPAVFCFSAGGNGGGTILCEDVDFSNLASSASLCDVDSYNDDLFNAVFINCKFPTSYTLNSGAMQAPNQRIEAYGCGTANEYYDLEISDYYGTVITETLKVRTGAATYDGTNERSYKVDVTTNGNTIAGVAGLRFTLGGRYADLATANQTITVYVMIDNTTQAATALTDHDIILRIKVPNDTNQALGDVVETGGTSFLKTATALPTDGSGSSNWEGEDAGAYAKYYAITKDLGAFTNVTNGLVEVEVEVMADSLHANDEIYICPEFTITNT